MDNAIEASIKGLRCDAPDCDYSDMDIDVEEYSKYIDAPCPDCGANLLTQADYDLVQSIMEITDVINVAFDGVDLEEGEIETLTVSMDGSGIPTIKTEKV